MNSKKISMKNVVSVMCVLLGAVLFVGCASVEPPERPVAYAFPTVRSMDALDGLQTLDVAPEAIHGWFDAIGIESELVKAGIQHDDYEILVRGLQRTGYAELDLRKTALSFRWVSVSCLRERGIEILVAYRERPKYIAQGEALFYKPARTGDVWVRRTIVKP